MSDQAVERIRLEGHIIDSLLLPKVLDLINRSGASFTIDDIHIGPRHQDASHAEITVRAADEEALQELLADLTVHGAVPLHPNDCRLAAADRDGVFPDGFCCSTNLPTWVRLDAEWLPVDLQEMDCGIVVDCEARTARCVPMHLVRTGERVVIGSGGVKIDPGHRVADDPDAFRFMASAVSSEKPKGVTVSDVAAQMRRTRAAGKKILLVGGPAIVHTGAVGHVCELIRKGYVQVLFAGNALAAHDIEHAFFRTSLGVHLSKGLPVEHGHENHLRAINRIRRVGGIAEAVDQGVLTSGIMYECVRHDVDYVLAGSIRDDGPLPGVITDALEAVAAMRERRDGVGFCLLVATMLHSIATGNILPASVYTACIDINPSTVTKLADRGTSHSLGIVTDVEPFLRSLVAELGEERGGEGEKGRGGEAAEGEGR